MLEPFVKVVKLDFEKFILELLY